MAIRAETSLTLNKIQAALFAPVLLAFTLGSLPVLLPLLLSRRIARALAPTSGLRCAHP